jgi:hypothetical protein
MFASLSIDLVGRSGGESLWADLWHGAWRCSQEGGFDVVPWHSWWQEDRDNVGCVVPGLELLLDLVAGSVGGELVKDDLGVAGDAPASWAGPGVRGARHEARTPPVRLPAGQQFAFQPGSESVVGLAEFGQCAFEDIDRFYPPEQCRVGLGDLERDLGPLPLASDQLQCLLQVHACHLAPGGRLRAGRFPQNPGPLPRRWRLGQRAAQQVSRGLWCAVIHRCQRGLPQPRQHPAITRWPHPGQMRGNLSWRSPIGVQERERCRDDRDTRRRDEKAGQARACGGAEAGPSWWPGPEGCLADRPGRTSAHLPRGGEQGLE